MDFRPRTFFFYQFQRTKRLGATYEGSKSITFNWRSAKSERKIDLRRKGYREGYRERSVTSFRQMRSRKLRKTRRRPNTSGRRRESIAEEFPSPSRTHKAPLNPGRRGWCQPDRVTCHNSPTIGKHSTVDVDALLGEIEEISGRLLILVGCCCRHCVSPCHDSGADGPAFYFFFINI